MDTLAAIILHGSKMADEEFLKNLVTRAETNRVPLLYLRTISKFHRDPLILSQLEKWEQRKRNYDNGFQKILQRLITSDIQFMLIKHAQYPRASFDVDLLFRNIEEYEKAMPTLRETVRLGLVRPDPHVGGLRDMRGCGIVIPTADLWSRRQKKSFFGMEVNIPSVEDQIILFHLHMLKHREIFLGDMISTLHLYNTGHNVALLSHLVDNYSLLPIFHFVSCLLNYLRLKEPEIMLKTPVLSHFINFLAYKKSQELFPIRVPKFILGLSFLHFSPL